MMASAFPSGKVREIEGDAENGEGKRTKNGQDLVKKRLITCEEGRFWNYEKALYRIDEGTTEEEDDGAKEEEKENVEEDDVLDVSFDSEVLTTSSETEGIKEETSYEKRPLEEALNQSVEGTMVVSLDVLFEKEQIVNDNNGTKNDGTTATEEKKQTHCDDNNGIMTPFIERLYEKTDDPHERYMAMMEEISRLEEKQKQIESMHITEEKHDSKFLMTNNGTTTEEETEVEYDAKAFLAALFKEMDDWWYICRAIRDEMDRGKEMREKISEELYSFQDGAIWLMMDAVENDDFFMMEKLTGNDYSRFYAEEEGHAEYEEEIHIKDYLNSLSCEELKEK